MILAAFFLAAGVALPLLVRALGKGIGQMKIQAKARMYTFILDSLQGMPEMLAFGQTGAVFQRIQEAQSELSHSERRMAKVTGTANALMGMSSHLGMLAVLVLGIILVEGRQIDGVLLGMLALGVLSSFEAVATLPAGQQYLEENEAAGRRLKHLIDEGRNLEKEKGRLDAPGLEPELAFENVRFRYEPDGPWVLDNISVKIPGGRRIGIVGQSGAGKSTLVNLLVRFWEPAAGEIRLGGVNIKELTPQVVRENMGIVSQKPYLFHATIKENLLLAKPEATNEELYEAARRARIHDFILSLPQGYDCLIGEEGMKLSGGQQQRLAIARVLLKDAPILILDEATSGLDPVTERELKEELFALAENRTLIVITHHLELVKDMDEILVLGKGRILEQGKHEELMRKKGQYRRLWEKGY